MNIRTFATEHRLKVNRDGEGEDVEHVIAGRIGQSQIYQHSETELGVLFMTDGKKPPRTGLFNTFRDACLEVGMTVHQLGDAEGSFIFDPLNPKQARIAIKSIRARAKKRISPEQAAAGAARLAAVRQARISVPGPQVERSVLP